MAKLKKFDIDAALDSIDLRFTGYVPSQQAFEFFNLIRIFMGEDFEIPNPIFHYFIVDMLYGNVKASDFPYSDEIKQTLSVHSDKIGIISSRGSAKALTLDSRVYTPTGYTTIRDINIGDKVLTRNGKTAAVLVKSEVFNKPTYKLTLADGRTLKLSEDHLNVVIVNENGHDIEKVLTTRELYMQIQVLMNLGVYSIPSITNAVMFDSDGVEFNVKDVISAHDKIPDAYLFTTVPQRVSLLQALLDIGGKIGTDGVLSFNSNSLNRISDVCELVRSLGGKATSISKTDLHIRLPKTIIPFSMSSKVADWEAYYPDLTATDLKTDITSILLVDTEPTQCISVGDETHTFLTDGYTITHNSTITSFFYPIVAAIRGELPATGPLSHILILSDSQQGGARDQARIMSNAFEKSKFANGWFESIRCTDSEIELVRKGTTDIKDRHMLIKFKGASALPLDTVLFTDTGTITMGDVTVGDAIFGADGKLCTVTEKSELFSNDIYRITLMDGRHLDVSTDHINSVLFNDGSGYTKADIVTTELIKEQLTTQENTPRLFIENVQPMQYTEKDLSIDPYNLGIIVGMQYTTMAKYQLTTSIDQRLEILRGIINTIEPAITEPSNFVFSANIRSIADSVKDLVWSLGGNVEELEPFVIEDGEFSKTVYRIAVTLNDIELVDNNLVIVPTEGIRCVAIKSIEKVPTVYSQCIAVDNEEKQYMAGAYIRTHNTGGIRSGSRNPVTGDRYALIIADDVIKNEADAYSEAIMHNVTTALLSDARNAMRAKRTQYVLINTPFHKLDPIYMMVESGGYTPLITPICKTIYEDMPKGEFIGLWEDMHSYEQVMDRYNEAVATNSTRAFNQELMLRVSNETDRLITDDMLQWYDRNLLMKTLDGYSLYVTTDFTTTSAAKSDFSVLAVWAVNSEDDWFLVDVCVRQQELQQQYDELMRMVRTWSRGGRVVEVGVEIDGQQKAHLYSIKERMLKDNLFFSFAKQRGAPVTREGILSRSGNTSKIDRFRYILPRFQNHKIYFPLQLKDNPDMLEGLKQLKGATHAGFSTHDDFPDVITQMGLIDLKIPVNSVEELTKSQEDGFLLSDGSIYWYDNHVSNDYNGSTIF